MRKVYKHITVAGSLCDQCMFGNSSWKTQYLIFTLRGGLKNSAAHSFCEQLKNRAKVHFAFLWTVKEQHIWPAQHFLFKFYEQFIDRVTDSDGEQFMDSAKTCFLALLWTVYTQSDQSMFVNSSWKMQNLHFAKI